MPSLSAARLSHYLQAIVDIRPGEGTRVAVLFLYATAAIGGVYTIGPAASDVLFISELPESALPYLLILPAASIIPGLLLYNRVAARLRLDHAIIGSNILLLAGVVLFRVLLDASFGKSFAILAALFVFIEFASTLVFLQFWNVAAEIFNTREAKRLFGFISAGGTIATTAAGLSLVALVTLIGVENLLWVVVLALLICIACVSMLARRQGGVAAPVSTPPAQQGGEHFVQELRTIGRSPLLRAIGALTVLLSLLSGIGYYMFYQSLQRHFAGRGAEMAVYLGAFEFWTGLAAIAVQIYLTGRLMHRFGIFVTLLFFPLGMALGAGLSLLMGGVLWAITLLLAPEPVFNRTMNTVALNVLYLPAPVKIRERAKELFEGVSAATFALAGVAFMLMQRVPAWNDVYYAIPVLVLAAAWLALLGWTRREYTRALVESLKRRVLDLEQATIDVTDETTVHVLINALHDPDELHVLHTLQIISGTSAVNWDAHVVPLLSHPSTTIRLQALRHLGRPGNVAHLASVVPLLDTPSSDVRATAITAYCAMAGPEASQRITPFLAEADPKVKGAAVVGLIQHDHGDHAQRATVELQRMLESRDPAMRLEGARVIGVVQSQALAARLIPLFIDANRDVRARAIQAAGSLKSQELVPYLLRALEDKPSVSAAAQALANYSTGIEAELGAALDNPRSAVSIPRILERMRTEAAVQVLLSRFHSSDDAIRGEIYRALARLRAAGVSYQLAAPVLRTALFEELRRGYGWVVLRTDLAAEGMDLLLSEVLRTRLGQTFDRIFSLLSLLSPNQTQQVHRVRQVLEAAPDTTRALAIELLDNLTERHVKELLLPLIEAPAERLLEIAQKQFSIERASSTEHLRTLALGSDRWLRICAVMRIAALRRTELSDAVLAALTSEEAVLRETALAACARLIEASHFTALLADHAYDDRFPIAQRYAQAQLEVLRSGRRATMTALQSPIEGGLMPVSTIERVLFLKGTELFKHIDSEELVPLAMIAQEVFFPAGATLIRQGEPGDCLYIIVAGVVSINLRDVGTVAQRRARDCIGEMGILSRQPRSADCVALTDLATLRIEQGDFWELLAEKPPLALGVIDTLSQRLAEAVANLQNVHHKDGAN